MSHDTAWYWGKAQALVAGWRRCFAIEPVTEQIVCPLSSAIHETSAGDAWPGPDGIVGTQDDERNWGACTLRSLNAGELAVLGAAGIRPTVGPGHVKAAADAMAALQASGLTLPQGVIHCDSRPVVGKGNVPYFTWFASFPDHASGAEYFLHLIAGSVAKRRPGYLALMSRSITEASLARAMYAGGYYTGFHVATDTSLIARTAVAEANIADYTASMRRSSGAIRAALVGWAPAPEPGPVVPTAAFAPMLDLSQTWLDDLQRARDAQLRDS